LVLPGRCVVRVQDGTWEEKLDAALADTTTKLVVVEDKRDKATWKKVARRLREISESEGPAVRWLAGPETAWQLCLDLETFLAVDAIGLQPISHAELDSWGARSLGANTEDPVPSLFLPDSDREYILRRVGFHLPVLEIWRDWLGKTPPEPVERKHADDFVLELETGSRRAREYSRRLGTGIPQLLRIGLHGLFRVCKEAYRGLEGELSEQDLLRMGEDLGDLEDLDVLAAGGFIPGTHWEATIEAAKLLHFVLRSGEGVPPTYEVPVSSALGQLILAPEFAA
jgi:hypothetical protein